MALGKRLAIIGNRKRKKMKLDVGIGEASPAADMAAGLEMVGGAKTLARRQPFHPDRGLAQQRHPGEQRHRLCAGELDIKLQVIHQVFTDARAGVHDRNAVFGQFRITGDMIAPALRITSRFALTFSTRPRRRYSTPVAVLPSKRIRLTKAPVTKRTLGFFMAGRR